MNRAILKENAKRQISGNIGILLLITLTVCIIISLAGVIPGAGGILVFALSPIFEMSLVMIYLRLTSGTQPEYLNLFDIFKNTKLCGNSIILYLLTSIYTFLWSLLFLIPGIIKNLSYSMAPFILAENEYYMTPSDAIKESMRIMEGHKMDLFMLLLSFIGWYLLGIVTCGIALIYVVPYYHATLANFYNEIKDRPQSADENAQTVIID